MSIGIKSNIDGSGEILKDGVNLLTLGSDNSVQGAFVDTDGFRIISTPRHNYIVDGAFDFWYEGVSQTIDGYGSDTMWSNLSSRSTKVHSRASFAVGEVFLDGTKCPAFYSRTVVTSVADASSYVIKGQNIENVSTLAGKKATLSFYAKADATKKIAVELCQSFGTGGSPSATVVGIDVQHINLTTIWAKYTVVFDVPSITGKVIGTNGDSKLITNFWFDAGTSNYARTASLGQQSGTFDLALVKLEEGEVATPYVRDVWYEAERVGRYFIPSVSGYGFAYDTTSIWVHYSFPVSMRKTPICKMVNTAPYIESPPQMAGKTGSSTTILQMGANRSGAYGRINGFTGLTFFQPALESGNMSFDARL